MTARCQKWFTNSSTARNSPLARRGLRLLSGGFVGCMRGLRGLDCGMRGQERLRREGLLILANHPTVIGAVLVMAFVRHADCIVKGRLWDNPFTRGPVSAAG